MRIRAGDCDLREFSHAQLPAAGHGHGAASVREPRRRLEVADRRNVARDDGLDRAGYLRRAAFFFAGFFDFFAAFGFAFAAFFGAPAAFFAAPAGRAYLAA